MTTNERMKYTSFYAIPQITEHENKIDTRWEIDVRAVESCGQHSW